MILGQNLKFRFCLLIVKMEQEMVYHDVLEGGVEEGSKHITWPPNKHHI